MIKAPKAKAVLNSGEMLSLITRTGVNVDVTSASHLMPNQSAGITLRVKGVRAFLCVRQGISAHVAQSVRCAAHQQHVQRARARASTFLDTNETRRCELGSSEKKRSSIIAVQNTPCS